MTSRNVWDAELYDGKLGFVSEFGKSVVQFLEPKQGESILDLGCGTGDLTNEIAKSGAIVTGSDLSDSMIQMAQHKYPHLNFIVNNAEHFRTASPYDAIFSNAALHWIKNAPSVVESIWLALKPGGRFVAEFGGKGNVQHIEEAITEVLNSQYGVAANVRNPWFFPSIGEYTSLLEHQGFRVTYALHFDRPTPLTDEENGLVHWLNSFADDFFQGFTEAKRNEAYQHIMNVARPHLYKDGTWYADYRRIRVVAVKEV